MEWCPKYRYAIFADEAVRSDCEQILQEAATFKQLSVLELAVMPDHVHMIARSKKPIDMSEILFYLKGKSAYELFRKHPKLRKQYWGGHLWSRGSFSRTGGLDLGYARLLVPQSRTARLQKRLSPRPERLT